VVGRRAPVEGDLVSEEKTYFNGMIVCPTCGGLGTLESSALGPDAIFCTDCDGEGMVPAEKEGES
jgi:DnaJ-class molecular chaperone